MPIFDDKSDIALVASKFSYFKLYFEFAELIINIYKRSKTDYTYYVNLLDFKFDDIFIKKFMYYLTKFKPVLTK